MSDDHRFEGLPDEVVALAKQAFCSRCKEPIAESSSLVGTVMVNYYVPSLDTRSRTILCGNCGLLLRELLHPELLENERWKARASYLRGRWA